MRLSTRTLLFAAAVAVVAAACSNSSVVATVDDATIDNASVVALRTSFSEDSSYSAEEYRADLTNLIFFEAQKNAAYDDFGLTGLDDPEAVAAKIADPAPEEAEILANVANTEDRTDATVAAVAEQFIIKEEVTAELVDDVEYLTDVYDNQPLMLVEVCARHILTGTQEEAQAAKVRIDDGEDFAVVAAEVSLDTASVGGQLPCPSPAGGYVPEFSTASATAPLGELTEPVPSEFGWHLIIVDERTEPETLDELLSDPLAYLHPTFVNDLWTGWFNDAISSADITVSSQIGTWEHDAYGILPPPTG
ncbi:MAG: peptidylprolyl isomerase [Actinomycetota bacterium]|nr:peptidylprolyl isomerase [Actinomycetota bacterium]